MKRAIYYKASFRSTTGEDLKLTWIQLRQPLFVWLIIRWRDRCQNNEGYIRRVSLCHWSGPLPSGLPRVELSNSPAALFSIQTPRGQPLWPVFQIAQLLPETVRGKKITSHNFAFRWWASKLTRFLSQLSSSIWYDRISSQTWGQFDPMYKTERLPSTSWHRNILYTC